MEDSAASRSPVWGLVKSKNLKSRDEKRGRIPNPRKPMQYTKSNMLWLRAADKWPPAYVGIDLHKKTLQVEVQDPGGNVVSNRKVQNTLAAIRREFTAIPQDTLCVMESSSVWYERFRFIRDDLGYDVVLSNPAQNQGDCRIQEKDRQGRRVHLGRSAQRRIHRRIARAGHASHRIKAAGQVQA